MKNKMKQWTLRALGMAVLALLTAWAAPAYAASPSSGATIKDRGSKYDSRGSMRPESHGWKVWVTSGSTAAELVLDESGTAPTTGILNKICTSSGATTETYAVYDSSTIVTLAQRELAGPITRAAAALVCSPELNVQFNRGLVGQASVTNGRSYIYWQKNGGSQ